jgi:DNA-cytosine methyltransferase
MGWENVFHVERDPFCRQVLAHHFPESQSFDDVKAFDATPFRGRIRVLSGGFPCQPFSAAGKRAGTSDDRYLWPEMFRIIREARPTYVVAENVRGLISWNEGLVLDTVCADLEGEGYEVFPVVLPAASVNAPHRRDRIWIVARDTNNKRYSSKQEISGRLYTNTERIAQNLLLTPTTREEPVDLDKFKARMEKYPNGTTMPNLATQVQQMLPTPTARCWNTGTEKERPADQPTRRSELNHLMAQEAGKPSQLSPLFVEEMMGFPLDWTVSPFQSGDESQ